MDEKPEMKTVYKYDKPFERQPLFFKCTEDQKIFLVASPDDARHINMSSKVEQELAEKF